MAASVGQRGPGDWSLPTRCLAVFGQVEKKGMSSPDGVTAEMLLALLEEQILCLARNIQVIFSSLWYIPVYIAQLDLKKAFDRISHDSIAAVLCRKNLSSNGGCTLQLVVFVAVLCKSVWDT